jgi:hypothetical protein
VSDGALRSIEAERPGVAVQLCYLVDDLDVALARWLATGAAGPFYRARFDLAGQSYRGGAASGVIDVAVGYRGDLMIELVQCVLPGANVFDERLAERGVGLHHVMLSSADMSADLDRHARRGEAVVASGSVPGFGRAAFADTCAELGHYTEYGEWSGPVLETLAAFAAAHRTWDGAKPVRPYPEVGPRRNTDLMELA